MICSSAILVIAVAYNSLQVLQPAPVLWNHGAVSAHSSIWSPRKAEDKCVESIVSELDNFSTSAFRCLSLQDFIRQAYTNSIAEPVYLFVRKHHAIAELLSIWLKLNSRNPDELRKYQEIERVRYSPVKSSKYWLTEALETTHS